MYRAPFNNLLRVANEKFNREGWQTYAANAWTRDDACVVIVNRRGPHKVGISIDATGFNLKSAMKVINELIDEGHINGLA